MPGGAVRQFFVSRMFLTFAAVAEQTLMNLHRAELYVVCLLAPSSLWSMGAHAEEEKEAESVTVFATRSEALVRDQPIRVEVLPTEEIEESLTMQPGNITTLLNELGGVRIQSTAAGLGGATLQMRGLPGRHTKEFGRSMAASSARGSKIRWSCNPPRIRAGCRSSMLTVRAMSSVQNCSCTTPWASFT